MFGVITSVREKVQWASDRARAQARRITRASVGKIVRAAAFVLICSMGGVAFGQEPTEPEVPTFGVDVNTTLGSVQTALTTLFWPFILFSIGVCVLFMLWRAARRFASGNA